MVLIKSFVLAALATSVAAKSAVIDLIPSNFDDLVFSGKPTLVEFFAPWCGHCKSLAPVYEDLALAFENAKDKVQIAKVDADAERDLGKRFGIQGFPTLKFFDGKSDKPEEYNGGRDLESLTAFITEKTGAKSKKKLEMPSNIVMLTDTTFPETIGGDKHVFVALTAPWCGHCKNLAPIWEQLATDYANDENVVIAKVEEGGNTKAVLKEQGVASFPTIRFFPAGSKKAIDYDGAGREEKDFLNFVNEKAGTHRVVGGGLDEAAGTVASLDAIVSKLIGGTVLAEAAAEAKEEALKLKETAHAKFSEYYVRVFDKLSKNEGYVAKELARLQKILAKGGLATAKRDELQSKTNVLRKFVQKVAEKAEETKEAKEEL